MHSPLEDVEEVTGWLCYCLPDFWDLSLWSWYSKNCLFRFPVLNNLWHPPHASPFSSVPTALRALIPCPNPQTKIKSAKAMRRVRLTDSSSELMFPVIFLRRKHVWAMCSVNKSKHECCGLSIRSFPSRTGSWNRWLWPFLLPQKLAVGG